MVDPVVDPSAEELSRWHRTFAPRFFNRAWELMDQEPVDDDTVDEMLSSAFAQRAHWYQVGDARHRAVADWQVSRAAAVAGHCGLALRFGERSLRQAAGLGPFLLGCGQEAVARASALAGDRDTAALHLGRARELCAQVDDEDERAVLTADLDDLDG